MATEKQYYAITWDVEGHNPPISKDKLPVGKSACDSILVASILHVDGQTEMLDGATSTGFISKNGRTNKELTPGELFHVWSSLTHTLIEKLPEGGRRDLWEVVVDALSNYILAKKEENGD